MVEGGEKPDTVTSKLIGMLMNNKFASFARARNIDGSRDRSIAGRDRAELHSLINIIVYYVCL